MNKRLFAVSVVLVCALLEWGCASRMNRLPRPETLNPAAEYRGEAGTPLLVGIAKEDVTPTGTTFIAGFGPMRLSRGVHDPIYARALVAKQGNEKLALVSVDVIGLQRTDVLAIKARVAGYREDQIIVASTHTHAGPDTLGLWGLPPFISGRSQKYIDRIGRAVAESVARADEAAVPVTAFTAVYEADPTIMFNSNEREPEDHNMGLLVFRDRSGKPVGTLWNVVGHPECMWSDNHILTADYPGRVCELIETKIGGGAIFFSGALGAMMTPARPGPGETHDFARMERISQKIFADVERGMDILEEERDPVLVHKMGRFMVPSGNKQFQMLMDLGILEREIYEGEEFLTEVNVIEIGSAHFVTFPGEVYPKLGLKLRERQGPHSFQIGLADDELGYIIYPDDYGTELYEYESSMCAGPELGVRMERAIMELLGTDPDK